MARNRLSSNLPLRSLVIIFSDGDTEIDYFCHKKAELKGNRNIKIEPVFANCKNATAFVNYSMRHITYIPAIA